MTQLASLPESVPLSPTTQGFWFDDSCILDMDYFLKTLISIKAKGVRPDLIGSIIAHYASKWLPDLDLDDNNKSATNILRLNSPESATSSWMKKRLFVETLIGILPPEHDSVPCNFLLRLLKTGNMVGVDPMYRDELENRIAWQLDQASLKDIMIPSFSCSSSSCAALLDVELVRRLVSKFVSLDNEGAIHKFVKVAKLVDSYLAEVGLDANLTLHDFVTLAASLPAHVRASDDGLYRAIDTYLKAHPSVLKQERKSLCRLIDSRKLSHEASLHAAQNERLPVRAVIQVIFSEQTKLNRNIDWSGSFNATRSPKPSRCPSKRQVTVQQVEIRRLREDVVRLQQECNVMQVQIETLKNKKRGFFRFVKYCLPSFRCVSLVEKIDDKESGEVGFLMAASVDTKNKLMRGRTPLNRKSSMS